MTHSEHPGTGPDDDFVPTEELVRRHGAQPVTSLDELAAAEDPFGSDAEHEEFLAHLYASRHSGTAARGTKPRHEPDGARTAI